MSDKHKDAQGEQPIKTWEERTPWRPGGYCDSADASKAMQAEIAELRAALARRASQVSAAAPSDDLLAQFLRCAYLVAPEINVRGYNWCEAWLDEVRKAVLDHATTLPSQPTAQQSPVVGQAVPEGWRIVPFEPTPEMVRACDVKFMPRLALAIYVAAYKTMLDNAPAAPTSENAEPMEATK